MKREKLYELLGEIDETYIMEARTLRGDRGSRFWKWGSAAACFVAIFAAAVLLIPRVWDDGQPIPSHGTTEALFVSSYHYSVAGSTFSSYVGGKVISEDRIGRKIEDVMVNAGWRDSNGTWTGMETLRGEIYEINGIPFETAAALRFIDQGDAVTTTHYYVILNPDADLHAVEEYQILPWMPNMPGEEAAGEIPE